MNKKKVIYNTINMLVILGTVLLFIHENTNNADIFSTDNVISVTVLLFVVALVHFVKAGRLYLALYGSEVDFITCFKTYCKVTPVSVIIPFKLGEFFRMYCYGKLLDNAIKGIVIILLDRFMDTIALVTAIFLVWIFNGGQMTSFVYILLIFLVFILLVYCLYPGGYKFWKKYLLTAKASENKLAALRILEAVDRLYQETQSVVKGRGIILYFLSLIAWGAEIESITLLNDTVENVQLSQTISRYLTSAIGGSQSIELKKFVIASVGLLIVIYLIIKVGEIVRGKKVQE